MAGQEACLSLAVPGFYWASVLQAGSTHVTNLGCSGSSSSPPPPAEVKVTQHGPGPQRCSYPAAYSMDFTVIFQEPGESPFFLWDVEGLGKSTALTLRCTVGMGCLGSGEETKVGNVY